MIFNAETQRSAEKSTEEPESEQALALAPVPSGLVLVSLRLPLRSLRLCVESTPSNSPLPPCYNSICMFRKVLIANRGEIAVRVIRTLREMSIPSVAVFSDPDRTSLHVRMADEAAHVGPGPSAESYLRIDRILAAPPPHRAAPPPPEPATVAPGPSAESYLRIDRILDAARLHGADAIHPGYGFLSENADFAAACDSTGIVFIGPSAASIRDMGSKTAARRTASAAGAPVIPGTDHAVTLDTLRDFAATHGYPVLLKAVAGGGGKGMRRVDRESDLESAFRNAASEAERAFHSPDIYVERLIERSRHIEIQLLGDHHGNMVHLGERECSIQRRHQKVIEECPSPLIALHPEMRHEMGQAAIRAARAAGYYNAGTVEFLVDSDRRFYFLEMNTRLQVEHPVTELVTGLDLVRLQVEIAAGAPLPFTQDQIAWRGAAIECRVYAEDPYNDFLPSPGKITRLTRPQPPTPRTPLPRQKHPPPPAPPAPAYASMAASSLAGPSPWNTIPCSPNSPSGPTPATTPPPA